VGEVKYLALDPGNATGWATFAADGSAVGFGTWHGKKEVYNGLLPDLKAVIIENFKLYPWKSMEQAWSQLDTVRIIGAVEHYCYLNELELVFQDPSVKAIAYKWAGMTPPKNHKLSHETDAYVHGVYYLQKAGIRTPQQGRAEK